MIYILILTVPQFSAFPTLARHAFGTIIGAHRAFKTLGKHRRSALQIHLTLLDLHPNILARDLCIMMLLHALMNQVEDAPPTERLEIKTTIFYTYIGVVLPGYCFERYAHMCFYDLQELSWESQIVPHYQRS